MDSIATKFSNRIVQDWSPSTIHILANYMRHNYDCAEMYDIFRGICSRQSHITGKMTDAAHYWNNACQPARIGKVPFDEQFPSLFWPNVVTNGNSALITGDLRKYGKKLTCVLSPNVSVQHHNKHNNMIVISARNENDILVEIDGRMHAHVVGTSYFLLNACDKTVTLTITNLWGKVAA